ncbi:hypothetical protein CES86_5125 [Brucella lupini]|uniref:Uncharacterized protein n=1 Tax=Brucella lupini TaxID=255457 RepID=A0A256GCI1_9HYPH|nr:hypothetical protein CES86_5125 [Brucella lupini]
MLLFVYHERRLRNFICTMNYRFIDRHSRGSRSGDRSASTNLLAICQEEPLILQKLTIILTNIMATPRHLSRVLLSTGARNIEACGRLTANFNRTN